MHWNLLSCSIQRLTLSVQSFNDELLLWACVKQIFMSKPDDPIPYWYAINFPPDPYSCINITTSHTSPASVFAGYSGTVSRAILSFRINELQYTHIRDVTRRKIQNTFCMKIFLVRRFCTISTLRDDQGVFCIFILSKLMTPYTMHLCHYFHSKKRSEYADFVFKSFVFLSFECIGNQEVGSCAYCDIQSVHGGTVHSNRTLNVHNIVRQVSHTPVQ